jgi:RsiW-degrading membrane proteinase PrsW (M82 family)
MFVVMFIARAILTVPMHAFSASMMGYYAAKRRFDGTGPGIVGGFALAVFLHGGFDASVFAMVHAAGQKEVGVAMLLLPVPIVLLVWAWVFVRRLARRALEADDAASQRAAALRPFGGAPPWW